jgi:predicted RNase H-like nuclease (RuvC/YqgF family)
MARQIVNQEIVNETADALTAEGVEPTIILVKDRIGGGSYTTIKRFLDKWQEQRVESATPTPEIPQEVLSKGNEAARAIWNVASREAQKEVEAIKNNASAEVTSAKNKLDEAVSEVARLEKFHDDHVAQIELQQARIRDVELALSEARTIADRVPKLEKELSDVQRELDSVRKENLEKSVEVGRLHGETEALRIQARELMDTLKIMKQQS